MTKHIGKPVAPAGPQWELICSDVHTNTARLAVGSGYLYRYVHFAGNGTPPGVGLVFVPVIGEFDEVQMKVPLDAS